MSRRVESVRRLPQGKMQKLKQMFEEKDAESSGARLYGMSPPKETDESVVLRRTTPLSDVGRAKSTIQSDFSGRKKEALNVGVRNSTGQLNSLHQEKYSGRHAQSRQRHGTEKQDWTTTFAKKAAAQRLSSTVSHHMAQSSDDECREKNGKEKSALDKWSIPPASREFNGRTKPVVTVLGQDMPCISNAQRRLGKPNAQSDFNSAGNFKSGMNIEPTWTAHRDRLSSERQEKASTREQTDSYTARSPSEVKLSKPRSMSDNELSPPPQKPPRTFAHDDYLSSKVRGHSVDIQNTQNKNEEQPEVSPGSSLKERLSFFSKIEDKEEMRPRQNIKDRYSHLIPKQNLMGGTTDTSPTHPPPSRLRAISETTSMQSQKGLIPLQNKAENDSDDDGPVVISLKYRRRLDHRASVAAPQSQPRNQLVDIDKLLQHGSLQKSFSSECLNKASMGSDGCGDESTGLLSSRVARNRREHQYEVLVDDDRYAQLHHYKRGHLAPESQETKASPSDSPISSTTPVTEQDVEKVAQGKLSLVRRKINQAYEQLYTVFPASQNEDFTDGDVFRTEDTSDLESVVDESVIKQRVRHLSTVRLRTSNTFMKSKELLDKVYPQLFEYALIVGLRTKTEDQDYEPYIIDKIPELMDSDPSVPKFCFPDADEIQPDSLTTESESYSFVLTNLTGERLFGYCRRLKPYDTNLPEVVCIVSPVDAFNMYNKLLSEVESQRLKSLEHAKNFIAASYSRPLPSPGSFIDIHLKDENGERKRVSVDRPSDQRLAGVNYESLLLYLGTEKLIKVFASMLMERRLILCSKYLSVLTQTIHALVALLYPFSWQHVYIPLLPRDMLDVCAAPMPFIIGILQSHLPQVLTLELEEVIIVDLDKKQVMRSEGDELNLLPKKVQKALKTAINMCKIDSDTINSQWLMVSEAFLRMFLETTGHFGKYIHTKQDGTKILQKEKFIGDVQSRGIRQFLEWFTETQMFEMFINTQLHRQYIGSMDLFMKRLGELQSKRLKDESSSKGLGQKVNRFRKAFRTKFN